MPTGHFSTARAVLASAACVGRTSRLLSVCLLGAVVALWNQWPLAGEQRAGHGPRSPIVRLSPAQAVQRATAARRGVSVQIAPGSS